MATKKRKHTPPASGRPQPPSRSRPQESEKGPTLLVPTAPQAPTNVQLRYLGPVNGREHAEIVGAAPFVDYLSAAIESAKRAEEVATATKRMLSDKTSGLYFTQEMEGLPFDSVRWRGEKNALGVEVAFTTQPKTLDHRVVEEAKTVLGPLLDAFVVINTTLELTGEIARWLCAGALGADGRSENGEPSEIRIIGPLAESLLKLHPELEGRGDVKVKREYALRGNFDAERRRRYGEMGPEQREMCWKLRKSGFAQPRVGVVRE